ncbi:MAG: hypothetical protein HYR97_07460 [Candidatus Melainabacteria bacterium]|nr:hypothetical protein [Candidatus Melainabacteria bacterium]
MSPTQVNLATFQKVTSTLTGRLQTLRDSRELDGGEQFVALLAKEDADAAGVPLHEIRDVSNTHTLEVLDDIKARRSNALNSWFTGAGSIHGDLTDIKTLFLQDRGAFNAAISDLAPRELRGLADIFTALSTNLISSNLALDITQDASAMGRELFRFAPTFDDIAEALTEVAASKEVAS